MGAGAFKAIGGIFSVVGQFAMVGAANRMATVAERSVVLAERNYNEVTVPSWAKLRDYYDRYNANFSGYESTYLAQAQAFITYTPDFAAQQSRATAGVVARCSNVRQRRKRMRTKYGYGLCCHENLLLDINEAAAIVEAVNQGYRFESDRKQHMDEWYWARQSQGMAMVESMRAHAISGLNQGSAQAAAGVSATAAAARSAAAAGQAQMNAWSDFSSWGASMANGAAQYMGFNQGMSMVPMVAPFQAPGLRLM